MNPMTRFGSVLGVVALFGLALATLIHRSQLPTEGSDGEVDFAGAHIPDIEVDRQDGSNVAIREMVPDGVSLVFLVSVNDCLVCQAEITQWRDLVNRHSIFTIVPVGVGGDRNTYREMAEREIPGSEFVFDDDHALLTALGAKPATPTRILLDGTRVVAVSQERSGDALLIATQDLLRRKESAMPPMK
ncbi:MAG: redoxin domain-containing protein [Gemmatimonadetes bacterium]|nr:redoxin domain-containing protein [Gemmatimonadota bacterium]MYG36459.1 redoxin domain-containing protein [Gemmatimonadota bacterium]